MNVAKGTNEEKTYQAMKNQDAVAMQGMKEGLEDATRVYNQADARYKAAMNAGQQKEIDDSKAARWPPP